jgi:hypothetical protein
MEGLMNIVVPAAWAFLIAMLVHQEALVGDRQFWLTRPYPRWSLLAAKLLFVLCFVHVPSFVFDIAVVQARGFNALAHLPALLAKQALLAVALTIPAFTLASLTRNLTQFGSVALICAVVGYWLVHSPVPPWRPPDTLRQIGAILLVTPGITAAVLLQYSRRRVALARTLAIAVFASAVLLAGYVPQRSITAAGCSGGSEVAIRMSQHGHPDLARFSYSQPGMVSIAIPIAATGIRSGEISRFGLLSFEVKNEFGEHWSVSDMSIRPGGGPPPRPDFLASMYMVEGEAVGWMSLWIRQNLYSAMSAHPVHLSGTFALNLSSWGEVHQVDVGTYGANIPGVGRCANLIVENSMTMYREDLLKTVCESPAEIPRARVEFVHVPTGRRVRRGLGDAGLHTGYPTHTWLSPVHRRNTFFQITDRPLENPGDRWLVMRSEVPDSKLELAPVVNAGCSIVRIDFPDIDLRKYVLR